MKNKQWVSYAVIQARHQTGLGALQRHHASNSDLVSEQQSFCQLRIVQRFQLSWSLTAP
jgi:hypothetical protein